MMKRIYTFMLLLCGIISTYAQSLYENNPKREVRAVWLTTIGGIDWPHSYAQSTYSIEKQKNELRQILDQLQKANINTVLLQTRVRGTMIYPSNYEPWDGCLSGFPGRSPGYDALQFAIEECHKRGMELHAWVVTIPVGKWDALGCRMLRKKFGNLIVKIGPDGYMNPQDARTGTYLANICREITRNYDIDGIHLDYIRYPETWSIKVSRERGRQYITDIVKKISYAVKSEKPWVKMSCSPIGKYCDLTRYWSHGWNAYEKVCQDAQAWLRDGLMDELFPMMYFRDNQFFPFAIDWSENNYGKIIAPGLGIYFLDPREGQWKIDDVTRQMYELRRIHLGHTFFRNKFFVDNHQGIYDFTRNDFDRYPALVPEMTWGKRVPTEIRYNLYASDTYPVDATDARNLLAIRQTRESINHIIKGVDKKYTLVTTIDRYNHEEIPEQAIHTAVSTTELLKCDGRTLQVEEKPSTLDAKFILIETLQGTPVKTYPYNKATIDIRNIREGIYYAKSLNSKGITHKLGMFIIKR
jgi:uncharacterized lipoprotein YddW (UPF0748 family)